MDESIIKEYYLIIKNKISQYRFESALKSAEKVIENFPKAAEGYYLSGICYFAMENNETAQLNYEKAIELNPAHSRAYFNLGVCHYMYNNFDDALKNIAKALVLFSKFKELDNKKRCIDALSLIEAERKGFKR